jgi:hypothetical protein
MMANINGKKAPQTTVNENEDPNLPQNIDAVTIDLDGSFIYDERIYTDYNHNAIDSYGEFDKIMNFTDAERADYIAYAANGFENDMIVQMIDAVRVSHGEMNMVVAADYNSEEYVDHSVVQFTTAALESAGML